MTEELKHFFETFYAANVNNKKLKQPIVLFVNDASQVFTMLTAITEYREYLISIKESLAKVNELTLTDVTQDLYNMMTKESDTINEYINRSINYITALENIIAEDLSKQ